MTRLVLVGCATFAVCFVLGWQVGGWLRPEKLRERKEHLTCVEFPDGGHMLLDLKEWSVQ